VADQATSANERPRRLDGGRETSTRPYISIVIAVRNAGSTLEACLASVVAQTYDDWELVVVDGASTDGTTRILERYSDRIAQWISEPDTGIYDAWNKALDVVRGTWIQFLGGDDRIASPTSLAKLAGALHRAEGQYRVVYANVQLVDDEGRVVTTWGAPWTVTRPLFLRGMTIPHPGTFHHRSLFDNEQRFDKNFRIAGDYEFLLRELVTAEALHVPDVLVDMGSRGVSNRPANLIAAAIESEQARRMHGLARGPAKWAPHVLLLRAKIAIGRVFGPKGVAVANRIYRTVQRR
jgi:glycosyltransferase involved in cell wall biosynthesis